MPPRASEMVSRADLGYEPATPTGQQSSLEVRGHSSMANIKYAQTSIIKGKRRRPRTNKGNNLKVDFSMETIQTKEVEHMDDLPGEDIWYSREEYDEIKARNSHIVRLIKNGEFEENDELSCRGLEHKLKEVFRQRRSNKFNALNAVLEEQDRQINRGITDADLISTAYQTVSVKCQESANTIAFRDYRFSCNYSPDKPATGFDQPIPPPPSDNRLGDSQSSISNKPGKDKKKKEKKKEKKEKKKEKKEEKKLEKERKKEKKKEKKEEKLKEKEEKKKLKEKEKMGAQQTQTQAEEEDEYAYAYDDDDDDEDEDDEDDPTLSPKGNKKGKVRKMARGARRMMRRMSM